MVTSSPRKALSILPDTARMNGLSEGKREEESEK